MQKQKKQFIIFLILLVVCAGAYLGVRIYNDHAEKKEEEQAAEEEITVAEITAEDITAFSYDFEGTELSFTKTEDGWIYDADSAVSLDQSSISAMLSNLVSLKAADKVEDYDDISEYGFDEPSRVITVTTEEKTYTFTFGMTNSILSQDYLMMDSDETVYLVSTTIKNAFEKSVADLTAEENTEM